MRLRADSTHPAPRDLIGAAAVAVAAFAVYFLTLQPSVPGGDSGELIAAAHRLGIAHPPGYPLYTMLGKLFTLLPWGGAAWRVNLLSAVCDALAAGVLHAFVARWSGSRWAGAVAGGMFAFSPLVWTYAVVAEVFPLHNLLVVSSLYAALRWSESGEIRWARAGAGLLGLGLANHHTLVLFAAPMAVWAAFSWQRRLLRPRSILELAACFAAGLLPYLYLPLAAAAHPPISWGDPSSPAGFLHHLLRRDYGTLRLGGTLPAGLFFFRQIASYAQAVVSETLWVGAALAAWGCRRSLAARAAGGRSFARLVLACFAIYVVVFHFAANLPVFDPLFREVTARFWQQPNVIVFAWLGVGAAALFHGPLAGRNALAAALACSLIAAQLAVRYPARDESRNTYVEAYGRAILGGVPEGAILLTRGDLVVNSLRYLQLCEGVRPDVTILDQELMTHAWYVAATARGGGGVTFPGSRYQPGAPGAFSMAAWLEANLARRAVSVYPDFKPGDASVRPYALWPEGLPLRVWRSSAVPDFESWDRRSAESLERLSSVPRPDPGRYGPGTWEHVVLEDLAQARNRRAAWLLDRAIERGDDAGLLARARELLEERLAEPPPADWSVYKNLGIVYDRLRRLDPGLLAKRDEAWRMYLRLAPAADPDRAAVAAAVGGSPY